MTKKKKVTFKYQSKKQKALFPITGLSRRIGNRDLIYYVFNIFYFQFSGCAEINYVKDSDGNCEELKVIKLQDAGSQEETNSGKYEKVTIFIIPGVCWNNFSC